MSLLTRSAAAMFAVAVFSTLAACAGMPPPEGGVVDAETVNDDEGIVFGMLMPYAYDSRGKPLTGNSVPDLPYELFVGTAESVHLKRVFSSFAPSISGNARQPQTFFAMKLPAGEYSLFELNRPLGRTTGDVPIDVRFTVAPNTATYIGSLQISFRATRGILGTETAGERVALKVVDDAAQATQIYKDRNPSAAQAIVTSLMKVRK